jgi:hypothetical protein
LTISKRTKSKVKFSFDEAKTDKHIIPIRQRNSPLNQTDKPRSMPLNMASFLESSSEPD